MTRGGAGSSAMGCEWRLYTRVRKREKPGRVSASLTKPALGLAGEGRLRVCIFGSKAVYISWGREDGRAGSGGVGQSVANRKSADVTLHSALPRTQVRSKARPAGACTN